MGGACYPAPPIQNNGCPFCQNVKPRVETAPRKLPPAVDRPHGTPRGPVPHAPHERCAADGASVVQPSRSLRRLLPHMIGLVRERGPPCLLPVKRRTMCFLSNLPSPPRARQAAGRGDKGALFIHAPATPRHRFGHVVSAAHHHHHTRHPSSLLPSFAVAQVRRA